MNVNLWFARNKKDEIVSILDSNSSDVFTCPICSSKVIPKALESKKVSPHFAHLDVTKCNGEAMVHWWFKHKFIERGDTFTVIADKEITFVCKDFKVEFDYETEHGIYRPDIVVETECGNEILFEMANTNKKVVKDYIDLWIELDKIVVEIDIKALQGSDNKFKALYYKGKCFNFNRRDGGYYNNIGKLKEQMIKNGKYDIELVRKLDWFWGEILKYVDNKEECSGLFYGIRELTSEHEAILNKLLKFHNITYIINDYYDWLKEIYINDIYIKRMELTLQDYSFDVKIEKAYLKKIAPEIKVTVHKDFIKYDSYLNYKTIDNKKYIDFKINEIIEGVLAEEYKPIYKFLKDGYEEHDILDNYDFNSTEKAHKINVTLREKHGESIKSRFFVSGDWNNSRFEVKIKFYIGIDSKKIGEISVFFDYKYLSVVEHLLFIYAHRFFESNKKIIKRYNGLKIFSDELNRAEGYFLEIKYIRSNKNRLEAYLTAKNKKNRKIFKNDFSIDDIKAFIAEDFNKNSCIECSSEINIKVGEIMFFLSNGLHLPKRCKACRNKRKLLK